MKLIIAEKPSVVASIAAALGVKEKKDGYIEGGGFLVSWCVGHLIGLAEAPPTGNSTKNGRLTAYPFCRRNGSTPSPPTGGNSFRP